MRLLKDPHGTVSGWGFRFIVIDEERAVAAFADESEALAYVALLGRKPAQA